MSNRLLLLRKGNRPLINYSFLGGLPSVCTFSRPSNATMFDSTGAMVWAPANMVLQSNDTSISPWGYDNTGTRETGITAPDGTPTAVRHTSTSSDYIIRQDLNGPYGYFTLSLWVRTDSTPFNLYLKLADKGTWSNNTSAYISVTNEWQRIHLHGPLTTTLGTRIGIGGGGTLSTGRQLEIWGVQVELTSYDSPQPYNPTTTAAYYGPRFDYDPSTLAMRGLLLEGAATNYIRNNTNQGAVAGSSGTMPTNWATYTSLTGLTRTLATGTEYGMPYLDIRVSGTPSGSAPYQIFLETSSGVSAASGDTFTLSSYIRIAAGSLTNVSNIRYSIHEYNSTPTYLAGNSSATFTPTPAHTRYTHIATLSQATTAYARPVFQFETNGSAIDVTFRLYYPQLEKSYAASSIVPTYGATATRAADSLSVSSPSWWRQDEGTIHLEFDYNGSRFLFPAIFNSYNSTGNFLLIYENVGVDEFSLKIHKDSSGLDSAVDLSAPAGATKLAAVYKAGTSACLSSRNGISGTAQTASNGIPPAPTVVYIERDSVGNHSNMWLKKFVYYNTAKPQAFLNNLTK